jgi:Predicted ATPase involved in cell division
MSDCDTGSARRFCATSISRSRPLLPVPHRPVRRRQDLAAEAAVPVAAADPRLVNLFGHDVSLLGKEEIADLRKRIGIVLQDFRLLDHMTTYENVALPFRVMGREESSYRKEVIDLLKWVGLGERMDALPPILSGGEKQRAAIARAVIARPQLLLAMSRPATSIRRWAAVAAAVHRTEQVRHRGDYRDPRHHADGPVRRAAAGAASGAAAYL